MAIEIIMICGKSDSKKFYNFSKLKSCKHFPVYIFMALPEFTSSGEMIQNFSYFSFTLSS